jgi:PadR family transcriptional regulator PadR
VTEKLSGVLPQRESESTMSNEKPKRASFTPPGNTPPVDNFGIGGRPRNWLEAVVLLSLKEWNSHGYELMQRARIFGFEAMNPGTLYRTLRRMEKDGVVESNWETSGGGPARRMYTITGSGEAHLGVWVTALERYQHSMENFFELYSGKSPHAD